MGSAAHQLAVPAFILDWLPNRDECENFIEISLFCLPRPLVGTERAVSEFRPPARKSAAALAVEFQRLLDTGAARNRADVARLVDRSRAWVTKVLGTGLADID